MPISNNRSPRIRPDQTTGQRALAWHYWWQQEMGDLNYKYRSYLQLPPKIYLPIPNRLKTQALSTGAHENKHGIYCTLGARTLTALHHYLPLGYNGIPGQINVQLIPKTAFYGSLARILYPVSWRHIKAPYITASGGRCRICGQITHKDPVSEHRSTKYIEAHELWSYHDSTDPDTGIQRLDNIMPLCSSCHMMHHLGYAKRIRLADYIYGRLQCFNMWDDTTVIPRIDEYFFTWAKRSKRQWIADVSILKTNEPIVIQPINASYADRLCGIHFKIGFRGTPMRNPLPFYADQSTS